MKIWMRKPQEQEGTHKFSGTFLVTAGVMSALSPEEMLAIYLDIQVLVRIKGGIDYFQVYENAAGDKLYFIDNCDPDLKEPELSMVEFNYCTLLFSHEY